MLEVPALDGSGMRFLTFTRGLLSFVVLWCDVFGIYWTTITVAFVPISSPLIRSLSLPLILFPLGALLLVWLPDQLDPAEWLLPILFVFLLYITSRILVIFPVGGVRDETGKTLFLMPYMPSVYYVCVVMYLGSSAGSFALLVVNGFRSANLPFKILYSIVFIGCCAVAADVGLFPFAALEQIIDAVEKADGYQ